MYSRVLQILGNRNVLTFCNDNTIRLCHIRGSIKKDMWINVGDIVLISIRDFLRDHDDKYEKGDILHKYDREDYSKLKKDNVINLRLFQCLENISLTDLKKLANSKDTNEDFLRNNRNLIIDKNDDDIFEDEEVVEYDNSKRHKDERKKIDDDDDLDIDAI
jgi:translation initiation factor 1A